MLVYLADIFCVLFFSYLNEYSLKREEKRKLLFFLSAFAVIMIPAIVAGLRNENVGTDVLFYAKHAAILAGKTESLGEFFFLIQGTGIDLCDIGYLVFAWISSRICVDYHFLLFSTELFIACFVYYSLYKCRKNVSICFGEMVFILTCYNSSLNTMRQAMACSVIMLAVVLLIEGKYSKFFACVIFASLFHITALIAFLAFPTYLLFGGVELKKKNEKSRLHCRKNRIRIFAITIILAISLLGFRNFLGLFLSLGLYQDRFMQYYNGVYEGVVSVPQLCVMILSLMPLIACQKKMFYGDFFLVLMIIHKFLFLLGVYSYPLQRLAFYMDYIQILTMAILRIEFKKSLWRVYIWAFIITYFWLTVIWHNDGQTVPYVSDILGIS